MLNNQCHQTGEITVIHQKNPGKAMARPVVGERHIGNLLHQAMLHHPLVWILAGLSVAANWVYVILHGN